MNELLTVPESLLYLNGEHVVVGSCEQAVDAHSSGFREVDDETYTLPWTELVERVAGSGDGVHYEFGGAGHLQETRWSSKG
ncbi:hypothetical protein SHJG_0087 [Streptomyces hygroscopicus subsp. jinggangensis 5008]|nr:hypothetical protein SHJG_0087 [Streptomyces hygroscopicus subsp. jinggangensis 5008]AGF59756.1 hypothetical protein SHJGH_0090 [Streptomyces hygroscopicus subsp. jinggangensis TL01]